MSQQITGSACPIVGVISEVTGDAIRLKGESRALLTNTAALSARLLGRAQGPQALVGRKVKLTRNPLQGDDVHVALVEEVQPRVEPGPLHQRMDRVDQRVSRWPGV